MNKYMVFKTKPFGILMLLVFLLCEFNSKAQENDSNTTFKRFPIITGIQFHNFAMPFKDMNSNFTHQGFYIGTEISYNNKETLIQQGTVGAYFNQEIGNGIYVSSQLGYRPRLYKSFFGELKAGISYLYVFHPAQAYKYVNGKWKEVIGGKSQLAIPLDFGFGYSLQSKMGELSPFITYQITPALFYNETLPLNIYTNVMVGIRIKFLKLK